MANVSGAKVSAPHTLFYSKRCPHSKNFMEKLQKYPDIGVLFEKYAIEEINQIPQGLQEVPSMIENGKNLIQGKQAFQWLKKKMQNNLDGAQGLSQISGAGSLDYASLDGNFMTGGNSFSGINDRDGSDFDKALFDEKTGLQKGQRTRTMESYASDRERGVQIPKPDNMARNVPSLG